MCIRDRVPPREPPLSCPDIPSSQPRACVPDGGLDSSRRRKGNQPAAPDILARLWESLDRLGACWSPGWTQWETAMLFHTGDRENACARGNLNIGDNPSCHTAFSTHHPQAAAAPCSKQNIDIERLFEISRITHRVPSIGFRTGACQSRQNMANDP